MVFRSRLTLKAIALMIGIVVLCTVVIGLFIISSTQEITYGMEEKYALSLLDRVEGLVRAKSQEIQSYRKQAMQAKKQELKDITAVAEGYIQSKYKEVQAGSLAEDRAKKEALERVRHFLYGDKDYIYIANFDSVLISHPDPKLHNADFSQINDIYRNPIVPALLGTAREKGQGFSSYWWNRLGRDKPSKKLTFSKLFVPWSWVYGTGVYLDDIEEEVRRKKTELIDQLRTMLSEITLGQTGYMFIFNADNKMIIHPDQGLEGRNFGHLKDPLTGEPIAGRLRAVAEQKEPLRYVWDSPDDQGNFAYDKLSWVRYNDQFDWYLCSSVYTDELHTNSMYLTK
ncbi:MAG: cache domain-containing protein, partial [Desulfohalobiaceae bacterium]|nr:cache domain-containing protein [Desulfohalobiaceae bacterium]